MRRFMTSIDAAAEASGQSLAAIKVGCRAPHWGSRNRSSLEAEGLDRVCKQIHARTQAQDLPWTSCSASPASLLAARHSGC